MEVAASSGRLTGLLCSPAGLLGGAAGPLGGVGLLEAVVEEVASGSRHFGLLLGGTAGLLGGAASCVVLLASLVVLLAPWVVLVFCITEVFFFF